MILKIIKAVNFCLFIEESWEERNVDCPNLKNTEHKRFLKIIAFGLIGVVSKYFHENISMMKKQNYIILRETAGNAWWKRGTHFPTPSGSKVGNS